MTVYDHTVHNPDLDNRQEIGGNDFKYDIQDGELTAGKAKELAQVYAKDQLGIDIPTDKIHVNQTDLDRINEAIKNGESGDFALHFTTDDGQKLCVIVTLYDGKVVKAEDVSTASGKKVVYKVVKTGDTADIYMWLALAVLAVSSGTVSVVLIRRKKAGIQKG